MGSVSAAILQRQCACGQHSVAGEQCDSCRKKEMMRQRDSGTMAGPLLPPMLHGMPRSPGQPLEPSTRATMERSFGHDFSHVRVHTDSSAAKSASAMNAMAYTLNGRAHVGNHFKGSDIYFSTGAYTPSTMQGKATLAHELAHVVQNQKAGPGSSTMNLETEARQASMTAMAGRPAPVQHASQQPVLAMTRAEHTAMWSGIGAGAGAGVGAIAGLIAAGATHGSASAFAGYGALIGGGVGLVAGFFYGLFKRRTDAVGAPEADTLIRRRFGNYLGGPTGLLNNALIRPVPHNELCIWNRCRHPENSACASNFVGWTDTGPEPPATIASADQEPVCENGQKLAHATVQRPVIYYATDVPDASVLVHEGIHAYANPAFATRLRNYVNEGATEYFTRQILDQINLPLETGYTDQLADVEKLVSITSEELLRRAFFLGEMGPLDAAVARRLGPCALDEWALALQMQTPAHAEEVLQGHGQNYCGSSGPSSGPSTGDSSRAAESSGQTQNAASTSGVLQRTCACGQQAESGECDECKKKKTILERKQISSSSPATAPPLVHQVLRSPGRPLNRETRTFFEPRFGREFTRTQVTPARQAAQPGIDITPPDDHYEREADAMAGRIVSGPSDSGTNHDLGSVRIHTNTEAAASARAVNARAYTVGQNIVFGPGEYRPESQEGRRLLAHELSHVAQQQKQPRMVQRSALSAIGDFFSGIGKAIARLFGSESYSEQELQDYLKKLDKGKPEGAYDSDNKARAITNAWRLGGSPYVLTAQRKALMIQDMQEGYTGTNDERAILELLERSYNFELSYILGAGGVTAAGLNSDIDGDEFQRLKDFYERRFDGGMEALLKGSVTPVGYPVPLGTVLPQIGETGMPIDSLPGANPAWNEECVTGILCTQDKSVVAALPGLTVLKTPAVTEYFWEYDGSAWKLNTKEHVAFSNSKKKIIGFKLDSDCGFAAASFVHEVRHQGQPQSWSIVEKEKDAYTYEENWMIERGVPGRSQFRMPKPGGGEQVDVPKVEQYVTQRYSGATSIQGEQITGHAADGQTEITKADGSTYTRPPQQNDTHQDFARTDAALGSAPKADSSKWVCPQK